MADADHERIRRVYEGFAAGDFTASVEVFAADAVLVMRPEFPDAGCYEGPNRIAEYTRALLAPWRDFSIEAEEIIPAGDGVVVAVRQSGVGETSGIETEFRYFHAWTFKDGKAVRMEACRERGEALAAVGAPGTT